MVRAATMWVVWAGLVASGLSLSGCGQPTATNRPSGVPPAGPVMRVVSLAPSLTEILFELGLGDRVVGVTDYCDYPPEAATRPKVGGYYDTNYELLVSLRPDLVVLLREHATAQTQLAGLGIRCQEFGTHSMADILETILALGRECGATERAEALVAEHRRRIQAVRDQVPAAAPRPRLLVSIGRGMGSGGVRDVYIAGRKTIFDELIGLAGGLNAYDGAMEYPTVSIEGILRMNPDIVIDLVADLESKGLDPREVRAEWDGLASVAAVRQGRVYVMGEDYVTVPGPRTTVLLERFAAIVRGPVAPERHGEPGSP